MHEGLHVDVVVGQGQRRPGTNSMPQHHKPHKATRHRAQAQQPWTAFRLPPAHTSCKHTHTQATSMAHVVAAAVDGLAACRHLTPRLTCTSHQATHASHTPQGPPTTSSQRPWMAASNRWSAVFSKLAVCSTLSFMRAMPKRVMPSTSPCHGGQECVGELVGVLVGAEKPLLSGTLSEASLQSFHAAASGPEGTAAASLARGLPNPIPPNNNMPLRPAPAPRTAHPVPRTLYVMQSASSMVCRLSMLMPCEPMV